MIRLTEKEKMIKVMFYDFQDPDLISDRNKAKELTRLYNLTAETELDTRLGLLPTTVY